MGFEGKVVVITGAGQGLGAGFAKDFAGQGAKVYLLGRTLSKVEKVAAEIRSQGGDACAMGCDVGDYTQVHDCFQRILEQAGQVDVLVNNAAYYHSSTVMDTSLEDWDRHINSNLNGTFYCIKSVLPGMIQRRYGKIINMSSSGAKLFFPGFGAYAASKGGIVSLTQILSEEVKNYGINVNAIYLGMTNTEQTRARIDTDPAITVKLDEMLQVDEVSKVVCFLASDAAAPIMGAAIDVFGKKA
ncbi:SDR family oxidoreductase [Pseudoflavonifractor sp. 524-17]|uniref:SDR family NAD(P)-dependent oxidoreductase n=1 Tax=Pseudoflavonifractor sp. 524-17 TaxID=2304577 RepID=UPI00137A5534|nr:SDR family NAD(P)-dependent oxidoreductase [Pseudoflavonifractor sp. 524-17]NCE63958.1 SDR family oxidoreductase [Pseudoflavonifractor sp. 524-17]